ncbi:hypothetical protein GGS20DRAFT_565976 [Poronia punctata]|nr:hypothetical protein GGS20DRAFT_565976 [Poronia punctata]
MAGGAHKAEASTAANRASSSGSAPTRHIQSTTPIPVPIPAPYASREAAHPPAPPKLQTTSTSKQPKAAAAAAAAAASTHSRPSSPTRPAYSPITPPLKPTEFPPRPTYTHASHVDSTAIPPPPPEPIDFSTNPDVLALKSAISILQMQRRKAERDMVTLDRVKNAALADPEAFIQDLITGRIHTEGERPLASSAETAQKFKGEEQKQDDDDDDDDDSDSDSDMEDVGQSTSNNTQDPATNQEGIEATERKPWESIPKPQNIVRCPPINWSQYAVVGESLDKLHNEQVMRPAQGTPAIVTSDGRYEFKGGDDGPGERYLGVAAPYAPGRDKIDRSKPKTAWKR